MATFFNPAPPPLDTHSAASTPWVASLQLKSWLGQILPAAAAAFINPVLLQHRPSASFTSIYGDSHNTEVELSG